jgi:hypothetical protein
LLKHHLYSRFHPRRNSSRTTSPHTHRHRCHEWRFFFW